MNPQRWQRIVELYESALDCPVEQQAEFLDKHCADDADLRNEVESLLAQDISSDGLLENVAKISATHHPLHSLERSPESIGPYRILGLIGEGGMGSVYEAQQEHPHRIIALKVMRPGPDTPEILRRFDQEMEALARLQHPGIVQIYHAGIEDGRPYFAMERIHGRPLLEYARELDYRQRLALMAKICDAAHHAHLRGIVHRDLKPANILVDETGQPKILDFGVARIADLSSEMTRGIVVGTLAYMSPEQVTGDSSMVDARSDVYSLGVILYEVLAGKPPYVTGDTLEQAVRVIADQEAPPLRAVSKQFRGDIETIVAKALEKNPGRRYASAADLGADIDRHLRDEPISAHPPGLAYQTRKFAARHKAFAGALAAVFVILVAGVIFSTMQASRARAAEQRAQAINEFLQNDLLIQAGPRGQAEPNSRPDPDLKVRTALERAASKVGERFAKQPDIEAALRVTIGRAYQDLGLFREAIPHLERAVTLNRRELGEEDPETLASIQALGELYSRAGMQADTERVLAPILEIQRRKLGSSDPTTLAIIDELAVAADIRGDYQRAGDLWRQLLTSYLIIRGDEDRDTLAIENNLATVYTNLGQFSEAAELYSKVVETKKRSLGPSHPSTLLSMNSLAVVDRDMGRYAESEELLKQVLAERQKAMGPEHPDTVGSQNSLALLYQAEGRMDEATRLLEQACATAVRLRPDLALTLNYQHNLGEQYGRIGQVDKARSLLNRVLQARRRVLGREHPNVGRTLTALGELEYQQKRYPAAEALLREALAIQEKAAARDWRRFYTQALLGATLAAMGRESESAPLLSSAYTQLLAHQEIIPADRKSVLETIRNLQSQKH